MPKINVYLPDDLADAVRETGVPISAICQRALEQAVRRMTVLRRAVLSDLDPAGLADRLPQFTARTVTTVTAGIDRARAAGAPNVTTGDLLHGMLAEGANMGLRVLNALEVDPATLTAPATPEPSMPPTPDQVESGGTSGGTASSGLRFSASAAVALELAMGEAVGMGHNYVGCEHLVVGLAAEPDGAAGELLRSRGADAKATRRAVTAAVAGFVHLRTTTAATTPPAGLLTAVRAELAPLIARIERLEERRN
jgi:ATP-dependent Clp protease ATP-binding subunit ClpA